MWNVAYKMINVTLFGSLLFILFDNKWLWSAETIMNFSYCLGITQGETLVLAG